MRVGAMIFCCRLKSQTAIAEVYYICVEVISHMEHTTLVPKLGE